MISKVYNIDGSQRQIPAAEIYLRALRYIVAGKEEKASYALNLVRDTVLENGHSSDLTDEMMQSVRPDLTMARFMALYGDYKYTEESRQRRLFNDRAHKVQTAEHDPVSSPWIRQPELLDMIAAHIAQLGDEEDAGACRIFLKRTRAQFSIKRPAEGMELVA